MRRDSYLSLIGLALGMLRPTSTTGQPSRAKSLARCKHNSKYCFNAAILLTQLDCQKPTKTCPPSIGPRHRTPCGANYAQVEWERQDWWRRWTRWTRLPKSLLSIGQPDGAKSYNRSVRLQYLASLRREGSVRTHSEGAFTMI